MSDLLLHRTVLPDFDDGRAGSGSSQTRAPCLFEWDARNDRLTAAPIFCALVGTAGEPPPPSGEAWLARLDPGEREYLVALRAQLTPEAPTYIARYRPPHARDNHTLLEEQGCAFFGADGRLERILGTLALLEEYQQVAHALVQRMLASPRVGLYVYSLARSADILINPQYTRITGYTRQALEQLGGPTCLALYHPSDQARVLAHRQALALAAEGEILELEFRLKAADGRWIWCLACESVLARHADGSVREVIATLLDMEPHHQAERESAESERRLAGLIESASDAIVGTDEQQRIILFNTSAEQMFGRSAGEVMGRPLAELIPERLRARHAAHMRAFAATGMTERRMGALSTLVAQRADGEEFPIEGSISQVQVEGGRIFTAILRDVTERVQTEEALRRSEARWQSLFDHAPVPIWEEDFSAVRARLDELRSAGVKDLAAHLAAHPEETARLAALVRIIAMSRSTLAGFDVPSMEELPRTLPEFLDAEGLCAFAEELAALWRGEVSFSRDSVRRGPDGRRRLFSLRLFVVPGHEKKLSRVLVSFMDVTKRSEAERALREQLKLQDQLSKVAASVPGMICSFQLDADGTTRMPYTNAQALDAIYGLHPEQVAEDAAPLLALIDARDIHHVQHTIEESARTLAPWRDEFRVHHPRKGELWVEGHSVPERQPDGSVLWHGYVHDVTTRKHAEDAVHISEERYRSLVELSPDAVFVNRNDRIVFVNPAAVRLFGAQHTEQLLGRSPFEVFHPDYHPLMRERIEEILQGGTVPLVEGLVRRLDGSVRQVEVAAGPFLDREGRAIQVLLRDITERRRLEQALRESEQRLRLTLHAAAVVAWELDPTSGAWHEVGPAGALFGRSEGFRHADLSAFAADVHPEDRASVMAELGAAARGERDYRSEFRILLPDSSVRWLAASGDLVPDAGGRAARLLGIVRDITERVRIEEALQEADRRKDEFLAMLAHELRNPLAPIRNAAHILGLLNLPDPRVQWVRKMVEQNVVHLSRLVDDLLEVSRIVRGKIPLKPEVVELAEIVDQALETVRPQIENGGHRLDVHMPGSAVRFLGDPVRLAQVLVNLLDNAAKYTPAGGHITLEAEVAGDTLALRVSDSGSGIAPELLPRVFDLFQQGERSLDRRSGGLGVGLTMVRGLVELHGGTVQADSAGTGCGSTFTVRLPLMEEPLRIQPADESLPLRAAPGARVLVVDDDEEVAESTAVLLRLQGHEVRVAHTGEDGLEQAATFRPDLVLLDIGLPGIDGYETARRLRARPEGASVCLVAVTGYGQREVRARSRLAGFDHHLVKPVDPQALSILLTIQNRS